MAREDLKERSKRLWQADADRDTPAEKRGKQVKSSRILFTEANAVSQRFLSFNIVR
jgi:hypothetical protein